MKSDTDLKRRNFLLAATLGGAGAVAAVVGGIGAAPAPKVDTAARTPAAGGYRLSEHVRHYYRTART